MLSRVQCMLENQHRLTEPGANEIEDDDGPRQASKVCVRSEHRHHVSMNSVYVGNMLFNNLIDFGGGIADLQAIHTREELEDPFKDPQNESECPSTDRNAAFWHKGRNNVCRKARLSPK